MTDRDTYLIRNKEVREIALKHGLDYCRQFSYRGPKVERTKFWYLYKSDLNVIADVIRDAKALSYVEDAFIYEPYNCSPRSVKVVYKS